jgi:hypothetical protein
MNRVIRYASLWAAMVIGGLSTSVGAQVAPPEAASASAPAPKPVKGIIPSGFGDSVDRDLARIRKATEKYKSPEAAQAAGYPLSSGCVANPPAGAMGYHFENASLLDATLDVEKPEILVYERMPDGSFKLNGVEYVVPIAAWTQDEPPTIMGQKLKRADSLGIYYLHVWTWEPSPSGVFADWNPRVKCPPAGSQ